MKKKYFLLIMIVQNKTCAKESEKFVIVCITEEIRGTDIKIL